MHKLYTILIVCYVGLHPCMRPFTSQPGVRCSKLTVTCGSADYCATTNNLSTVLDLPNFRFVKGCIQSFDLVAHILESEKIDTVMHFAAQVLLNLSCPLISSSRSLVHKIWCSCHVMGSILSKIPLKLWLSLFSPQQVGHAIDTVGHAIDTILPMKRLKVP
jgi:hypothetical protein